MSDTDDAQHDFWNKGPGERWAEFQPDLDLMQQGVADRLMALAAPRPGMRVLDIGCGAGATTLAAARAVAPQGQVTGADISEVLLARARDRAAAEGVADAAFLRADAQTAQMGGPFDLALSRFGVMFFADPQAAFANIRRQLARAGRLVFAAWSGSARNPWFHVPRAAAEARLGRGAPGDPEAPGPMALQDPARIAALLSAAGYARPQIRTEEVVLHHPGGLDAVMRTIPFIGPVGGLMREKAGDAADLEAILDSVAITFSQWDRPDGLHLPAEINLVTAAGA
ncbi:class I SAM-dependent methyltransferase [Mangrovicoccus algicola]|uniref:Methyltransferase domain-containing protein n=1 Tax=Mangrovicoccus algicola TaxID=2771008 RepID=A0A8J6YU32_9RHOB|nr:methyltransferase domain-containing protein [Mangrovicoccus algicola]MBE3639288.1 methyltransferase domain-containing protein [Mangrovicoccus algicola]